MPAGVLRVQLLDTGRRMDEDAEEMVVWARAYACVRFKPVGLV